MTTTDAWPEGIPRCTATSSQSGQRCRNRPMAGGTVCSTHGGMAPQVRAAAARRLEMDKAQKALVSYGRPRAVDPHSALLEEVHRTAGHVSWLGAIVAAIEQGDLVWGVAEEKGHEITRKAGPNVWLALYQQERKHLVDVCRAAIGAGIEERRVRLAEAQGELLGGVVQRILLSLLGALVELLGPYEAARRAVEGAWSVWVGEIVPREIRAAEAGVLEAGGAA